MNKQVRIWEADVLDQMYDINFQSEIHTYFQLDEKYLNNKNDWGLLNCFAKNLILKCNQNPSQNINDMEINEEVASTNEEVVLTQVFIKEQLKDIGKLLALIRKIRKGIIQTQLLLISSKKNKNEENASMFKEYCILGQFLFEGSFQLKLQTNYRDLQKEIYSIIDLFVFSTLHKGRCFHRIVYKLPSITTSSGKQINPLVDWYNLFFQKFQQIIKNQVDTEFLPRKEKREQIAREIQVKYSPQIFSAVQSGDIEQFKILVKEGQSIDSIEPRSQMMVPHVACLWGRIEICKLLNEMNIDWEVNDGEKMSPLFHAVRSNSLSLVKYLCKDIKVNIEHKDIQDRTPFYYACSLGELPMVKLLVEFGADINAKTALMRSPLSKSCFLGQIEIVDYLLQFPQITISDQDKQGRTALHNAVFGAKGGRDNKKIGTFDRDCPEAAQLLLERGADPNCLDKSKQTPLIIAASSEALQSIPILIAFGANIDQVSKFGDSPLITASKFGHIETIRMLVETYNADLLIENNIYHNCLITSVKDKHFDVYMYLIQKFVKLLSTMQNSDNYVIQNQLYQIIQLSSQLEDNQYIKVFIKLLGSKIVFDQKYLKFIEQICLLKDQECLKLIFDLYQQYLKVSLDQSQIEQLCINSFLTIIKKENYKVLEYVIGLCPQLKIPLSLQMVELIMKLDEQKLCNILQHLDWISYRNKNNETILFKLVQMRHSGVIIHIISFFQEFQQSQNRTIIKDFLFCKDKQSQSTVIDLALLNGYMDLYQILQNFIEINFSDMVVEQKTIFSIPKYSLKILEGTEMKCHQYKQTLMNLNSQLENVDLGLQHYLDFFNNSILQKTQLNPKEIIFLDQINSQQNAQISFVDQLKSRQVLIVDNEKKYHQFVQEIQDFHMIAVDIESYSEKTSQAKVNKIHKYPQIIFICTVQISTVDCDYVIDCLSIRDLVIQSGVIKSIFEDMNNLKIFHGCDTDLKLLYTNMGISIMNIFDTSRAYMKLMNHNNTVSLQFLCNQYLNIHLDKHYQTSDWRLRPLPAQMANYAREDSGVLLLLFPLLLVECLNTIPQIMIANNKICYKSLDKCSLQMISLMIEK